MKNAAVETRFRCIYTPKMQNASLAWYQIFFCKNWTIQIEHTMFALGTFMFRFFEARDAGDNVFNENNDYFLLVGV